MKYVMASLLSCALAGQAMAQVDVTGTGSVSATPDIAYITVGVITRAPTAAEAVTLNKASTNDLYGVIREKGVEDKDFRTTTFSVSPQYRHQQNVEPVLTGYMVVNSVHVKFRALDEFGDFLDAVVQNGANQVSGIQFDVCEKQALLDQARVAAVKDAERKAKMMIEAAGGRLGPVLKISEQGDIGRVYGNRAMEMMADGPGGVDVAAGEMEISVTVQAVFFVHVDFE